MFDWRCMDCSHIFLRDPSYLKLRAQEAIHRTNSSYFEALWPWFSAFSLAGWGWREPWCAQLWCCGDGLGGRGNTGQAGFSLGLIMTRLNSAVIGTVIGQAVQQVLVAWISLTSQLHLRNGTSKLGALFFCWVIFDMSRSFAIFLLTFFLLRAIKSS